MRKPLVLAGALAFAALSLAVGASGPRSSDAAEPLRMTVGTLGRIGDLDVRTGTSRIAREVWNLQYPTLTSLDPETLEPTTSVASGWAPTPNGRGWIYTLRAGSNWSDGKPVTATDVVYSFTHGRDERWPFEGEFLGGLTIRAVNEHSVEVTSDVGKRPSPGLLLHVVPAHVYSKFSDSVVRDLAALGVGGGAWHVVAKSANSVQLDVLGRPAGPPLDQIVFRTYPSADALVDALERGDVDVISGVPYSYLGRLEGIDSVTVNHAPHGKRYVVRLKSRHGKELRAVVSLAIDREALIADAVNGVATPAPVAARPDEARKALNRLDPDGNLHATIQIGNDPVNRRVAAFVLEALRAVGLKSETEPDRPGNAGGDLAIELNTDRDGTNLTVPLFDVDSLQAFRTDNVSGFLREPSQRSLVVFGPTAAQYGAIVPAQIPPGEQLGNLTYAISAAVLLALCAAAYWIASRIRNRLAP